MPIVEAPAGVVRVEQIMGMPIVVDVRDIVEPAALDPLFDWFREVDTRFSTYNSESEISRLNRGELTPIETHPDVREVLARCDEIRVETHGYFDARAHAAGDIDPSGLVKGWAVDRAAELADELGWRTWAISAGGDMRLRAARPDPSWRVGIQDPTNRSHVVAVVEADDLAIATSGDLRARRAHRRPAQPAPADGRFLGDDHRKRPCHRRRVCDRRVRDGHRWPRLDRATTVLRRADASRRRPLTAHAGLRTSPLVRDQAPRSAERLETAGWRTPPRLGDHGHKLSRVLPLQLIAVPWA